MTHCDKVQQIYDCHACGTAETATGDRQGKLHEQEQYEMQLYTSQDLDVDLSRIDQMHEIPAIPDKCERGRKIKIRFYVQSMPALEELAIGLFHARGLRMEPSWSHAARLGIDSRRGGTTGRRAPRPDGRVCSPGCNSLRLASDSQRAWGSWRSVDALHKETLKWK